MQELFLEFLPGRVQNLPTQANEAIDKGQAVASRAEVCTWAFSACAICMFLVVLSALLKLCTGLHAKMPPFQKDSSPYSAHFAVPSLGGRILLNL